MLEIPVLSSLWETQSSFSNLLRVLGPVTDEEVRDCSSRDPVSQPSHFNSIGYGAQSLWEPVEQVPEMRELDASTVYTSGRPP